MFVGSMSVSDEEAKDREIGREDIEIESAQSSIGSGYPPRPRGKVRELVARVEGWKQGCLWLGSSGSHCTYRVIIMYFVRTTRCPDVRGPESCDFQLWI